MPTEDAAEALAELEGSVAVDVLENLDADVAARSSPRWSPTTPPTCWTSWTRSTATSCWAS